MDKQEVYDYLEVEFNASDISDLSYADRLVAYERLKGKLLEKNLPPNEYTAAIIELSNHLEV